MRPEAEVELAMEALAQAARRLPEDSTVKAKVTRAVDNAANEVYTQFRQANEYVRLDAGGSSGGLCGGMARATMVLVHSIIAMLASMVTPMVYFGIGVAVYWYLEGWTPLDTVYFLIVTSTTVGYGDMSPATAGGKAFTTVYALIGIVTIISALSPLVAFLRGDWRERLLACVGLAPKVDLNDPRLTMEEVNALINYKRRYALALLSPALILVLGMFVHYEFIREPPTGTAAEAAYWSPLRSIGVPAEWLYVVDDIDLGGLLGERLRAQRADGDVGWGVGVGRKMYIRGLGSVCSFGARSDP